MYVKLAIDNAKKSIKDYLIYFITITICVSLFYAFTSLSSSSYELSVKGAYEFYGLKNILASSTYIITGLLIILVSYVSKYMIKRRQREFATYILLGAEQRNVALMFFIETLIVGVLAIICGILIGTLFSQVVTAVVYISINQEVVFLFRLYIDTVIKTFIFFISMFCVIGLYNVRVLNKLKLIDMINISKKSEFQFKRSGKLYSFIFTVCIILYSICGYCTFKLIKLKDNAEVLVSSEKLILGAVLLVSFILATYALFYSISYMVIFIKNKFIGFKYEGTNLFLIGSIVSKIKTSPILMGTISITFLGAAISFILILILSQWSIGYLHTRVPFDIDIRNKYYYEGKKEHSIKNINDIPKLNYKEIVEYLESKNGIKDYAQVEKYFINKEDFDKRENMPVLAIKLSDFNKLRSMLGYEQISLENNEFTTQWYKAVDKSQINKYIKENPEIDVNGKKLIISKNPYYIDSIGEGIYNFHTDSLIILPDEECENLTLASTNFFANINKEMTYKEANAFEGEYIPNWFIKNNSKLNNNDDHYYFISGRIKSAETNEIVNVTLGMRILGIYLGTVLLMISLTVLSLQQLTDSIEHKDRFNILRKLGIEDKEINKIVLKQISIYFIVPIFIAIIGFIIFMYNYYVINIQIINFYIGEEVFVLNIIIGLVLMLAIYVCYFLGTYYTFKRNINS